MGLYSEIMNIQICDKEVEEHFTKEAYAGYKVGKREMRSDAAELALKAEARIEELETALKELYVTSATVANCAYNVGQSHEDWENIKQWIDKLDNARAIAIKVFQEKR